MFGDHILDQFMVGLTGAFLVAIHGVTVKHTALDLFCFWILFDSQWICKLTPAIRHNHLKQHGKILFSQLLTLALKNLRYACRCLSISQEHQLKIAGRQENRQDCLPSSIENDTVHLANQGIWVLLHIDLKVLIGSSHMAGSVYTENWTTFLPLWPSQLSAQIDIPGIQQTSVYIGIERTVCNRQFISVAFTYRWQGLPFLQEGRDGFIDPIQLLLCKGESLTRF